MPSIKRANVEGQDRGSSILGGHENARPRLLKPLSYSGSLDSFKHADVTPIIGREFEGLQVTDLLKWGDEMIRDLAITSMGRSNRMQRIIHSQKQFLNVVLCSSVISK